MKNTKIEDFRDKLIMQSQKKISSGVNASGVSSSLEESKDAAPNFSISMAFDSVRDENIAE